MKRFLAGGAVRDILWNFDFQDHDFVLFNPDHIILPLSTRVKQSYPVFKERSTGFEYKMIYSLYTPDRIIEDLKDRDFTINAMAIPVSDYDPLKVVKESFTIKDISSIIDPTGGYIDIQNRILRMISDENIRKDPIRILRGFRLMIDKKLIIDPSTLSSFHKYKKDLCNVRDGKIYKTISQSKNLSAFMDTLWNYDFITTLFPYSNFRSSPKIQMYNLLLH